MCVRVGGSCVCVWGCKRQLVCEGVGLCVCTCTVPVRKKFPTVEYFFYGDTRSTNSSTRTRLLCYGSGIQRTAQYVSTLTTHTSVAMITWREMYVILSNLLVLVFARQSSQILLPELHAQCLRVLRYSVRVATVSRYDSTRR